MQQVNLKSPVQEELEERRSDSEVKDILNDLERLKSVSPERRTRWVWELIQNAKDCVLTAGKEESRFVDIEFIVENNKLTFTHNGPPFCLGNLVALVTRTSDKEYIPGEGTVSTGKYGTGFVTSHVLNRKVTVSGLLQNDTGLRRFSLLIDRSFNSPTTLREELNKAYEKLDAFYLNPPETDTTGVLTRYEYELDEEGCITAENSITDLKKDLSFVLLINPTIRSVTVRHTEAGIINKYESTKAEEPFTGIQFSRLLDGHSDNPDKIEGLFHLTANDITIAIPVKREKDTWTLKSLDREVRLFKELPLIGTEGWHLPYYIQSSRFSPPESRDGIRTAKPNEDKGDSIASQNRLALEAFRDLSIQFFKLLLVTPVEQIYLLTESGFPNEKIEYTASIWYREKIQEPLRKFFRTHDLVRTASKTLISIEKAKIPQRFESPQDNQDFYDIAVKFYGDVFPDENSYKEWQKILEQDTASWGVNSFCTLQQFANEIHQCQKLETLLSRSKDCNLGWLNSFIGFLFQVNEAGITESLNLYPNQLGQLKRKQDIRIDPPLNPVIKHLSTILQMSFLPKLLDNSISNNRGVSPFETEAWYKSLNDAIGKLQPSQQTTAQFTAVLGLIALFRSAPARERERWYLLIKQLLPLTVPDRTVINDLEDFNFDSAEYASIRYTCWLIQESKTIPAFAEYFQSNLATTYIWLNDFIDILYRKKETYAELPSKFAVIPTQDDQFRKLTSGIFAEGEPFDLKLKTLYTQYAGKGNALEMLIKTEIQNENLQKATRHILTTPIDNLFANSDCEVKVEKDKPLHELFHELNTWISENENIKQDLFPHFSTRMPTLYVKAYGAGMSKLIMAASKLNWSAEEFESIGELNLRPEDLEKLTRASKMAGGPERLLKEAARIEEEIQKAEWRQKIGKKAEASFNNVIANLQAYNITNPDKGFDFEIHLGDFPTYMVEIKSTVFSKGNIKMSGLQGKTARDNKKRYALCVVTREEADTEVDEDYFKKNARFVINIGTLVEDKVNGMENGLISIRPLRDGEINSSLEDEKYSVYISTGIWQDGKTYDQFVDYLKAYFPAQKQIKG